MFTRTAFVLATSLIVGLTFTSGVRADDNKLSDKDQKFVQDDANGGNMEVYLGKLATQKATNSDVKDAAQKLVDDHTKANDQLKALAQSKGYDIKEENEKEQKAFDKLNKLSGDAFDKEYIDMMVRDHEKTIKEFEDEAKNADDADLKKFASDTLPILQEHLKIVKDIQSKIGK
jgi:putative membrane protein